MRSGQRLCGSASRPIFGAAGSTKLATTQPPAEVVGLLNEFFGIVVATVNRYAPRWLPP